MDSDQLSAELKLNNLNIQFISHLKKQVKKDYSGKEIEVDDNDDKRMLALESRCILVMG